MWVRAQGAARTGEGEVALASGWINYVSASRETRRECAESVREDEGSCTGRVGGALADPAQIAETRW